MRPPSQETLLDAAAAFLAAAVLLLSLFSAALVLLFRLRSSRYRRRRQVMGLSSLWPARLLLSLFSALLALPPLLLHFLPRHIEALHPSLLCQIYAVSTQSFAEPSFFAVLLFLLRASTAQQSNAAAASPRSAGATAGAALAAAFASSLPFLALHALALGLPAHVLRHVGIPTEFLASGYSPSSQRCAHPLVGTLLLAALGALYVPLFASACLGAVSVVINKRLSVRLYALAGAVVVALSVQVAALALSALWAPGAAVARGFDLASLVAVMACAASGEGILVIQPVVDALAICEPVAPVMDEDGDGGGGELGSKKGKRDDSGQALEEGLRLTTQR